MAAENDILRELLQQMKELTCKQDAALTAINNLTLRVSNLEVSNACGYTRQAHSQQDAESTAINNQTGVGNLEAQLETSNACDNTSHAPTRTSGYYFNWNTTHDILKTQQWLLLSDIMYFAGQIERGEETYFPPNFLMSSDNIVNEDTRFPQMFKTRDNVFVDVSNPLVWAYLLQLKEINKGNKGNKENKGAQGLVESVLNVVKNYMHSRSSFEDKYGIKWVEL